MLCMRSFVVKVCIDQFLALSKPSAERSSLCYHAKPQVLCYVHIMLCVLLYVLSCMTNVW